MITPPPQKPARTRWPEVVFAGLFILLLWLPTIDAFFHFDHTMEINEKRLPANWPQYSSSWRGLKEYESGLEKYFNDHFGFRKQLIHWQLGWQLAFFNGGRSDVMMGKDGCMFFDERGMHLVENFQGLRPFSAQELVELQQFHEARRAWLAARGCQYLFIVAPDKQSIYPDLLPGWLKPTGRPTKLDQFFDYMHNHSEVTAPDLRPALRAARKIEPTYYKTDSHWNSFGGFVASEELAKLIPVKPDFKPLSLDSFGLKKTPVVRGDLALLLGVYAVEDDLVLTPKTNLPPLVQTEENSAYTVPTFYTSNAVAHGSCVVFRDSFGPALIPFLGYHFKTVDYYWSPGGFDTNIIARVKPDVVISEIVERHFNESGK